MSRRIKISRGIQMNHRVMNLLQNFESGEIILITIIINNACLNNQKYFLLLDKIQEFSASLSVVLSTSMMPLAVFTNVFNPNRFVRTKIATVDVDESWKMKIGETDQSVCCRIHDALLLCATGGNKLPLTPTNANFNRQVHLVNWHLNT